MNRTATMRLAALCLAGALSAPALGFGSNDHSTVQVESTSDANGALSLHFKVVPASGMKINLEGPWKLDVKNADGLVLAKSSLGRSEFDEGQSWFVVTSKDKPAKANGKIDYSLVAFVCTQDKKQCFRDVHNGTADWKI